MGQRRKTEIVQVNLRLREEFRQRLVREAEKSGRSFNHEIVHRLEKTFRRDSAVDAFEVVGKALAVDHEERMQQLQAEAASIKAQREKVEAMLNDVMKRERAIQDIMGAIEELIQKKGGGK
jgi:Arc-like DNA binding dprotein